MKKRQRKQRRGSKRESKDNLVQVDIYYLPKEQAEMYRVLREAVADEVFEWFESQYHHVERKADPELGEAIIGFSEAEEEVARYELNPQNISQAQQARDKHQIHAYLEQLYLEDELE